MGSAPSVTTESVVKRRSVRGASRTSANGGAVAGFFSPRRRGDSHPQQMGFELQQKLGFGRWPLAVGKSFVIKQKYFDQMFQNLDSYLFRQRICCFMCSISQIGFNFVNVGLSFVVHRRRFRSQTSDNMDR